MEIPLQNDIIIIFGLPIAVLFICHRFHIPTVVVFLLTGIIAGPYGLGLIKAIHNVEIFAEVGIVLLLFTIGIELSIERLLQITKSILMGGSLQELLTFSIEFRRRYEISLVAIQRGSKILPNPDTDILLHSNDILFVLESSEKISKAINKFLFSNKGNQKS